MNNKLLTAQYILKNPSVQQASGFNRKIYGEPYPDIKEGFEIMQGYLYAEKMINEGAIYYTHNFHKLECPRAVPSDAFIYGGHWVCNSCGKSRVDRPYWNIKIIKDGNEWCCRGEGFENLQISSNYAFGKTREEALTNYHNLIIKELT